MSRSTPPPLWTFRTPNGHVIHIHATNWLIALGLGLEKIGVVGGIGRMVFRRLGAHTIVADDMVTGQRYTLQDAGEVPSSHKHCAVA